MKVKCLFCEKEVSIIESGMPSTFTYNCELCGAYSISNRTKNIFKNHEDKIDLDGLCELVRSMVKKSKEVPIITAKVVNAFIEH